jgi:hypothetical protein
MPEMKGRWRCGAASGAVKARPMPGTLAQERRILSADPPIASSKFFIEICLRPTAATPSGGRLLDPLSYPRSPNGCYKSRELAPVLCLLSECLCNVSFPDRCFRALNVSKYMVYWHDPRLEMEHPKYQLGSSGAHGSIFWEV